MDGLVLVRDPAGGMVVLTQFGTPGVRVMDPQPPALVMGGFRGVPGQAGAKGDTGTGIEIAGSVATYGDLPTGLGPTDAGKAYFVAADGDLYIWDGSAFPADGSGTTFQGPAGTAATVAVGTVTTGAAGSSAAVVNAGTSNAAVLNFTIPKGDKGDTGNTGDTGTAGTNGTKWFNGAGAPGSVSGSAVGDYYLDTTSGDVYVLS